MLADYHVHTYYSDDSEYPMEEVIKDAISLGLYGLPLYREHTCFEDGDYCDFKIKLGAPVLKAWPPVFTQGNGYK